jgi:uncharacterized membrane protein
MNWECVSYWIEHHPGLASWVQAVGSIGAILVAVWIMSKQHSRQAKLDHESTQADYDKAAAVTEYISKYLIETAESLRIDRSFEAVDYAKVTVDSMIITLSEMPFHLFEDTESAMAWVETRASAMRFRRNLETLTINPIR